MSRSPAVAAVRSPHFPHVAAFVTEVGEWFMKVWTVVTTFVPVGSPF